MIKIKTIQLKALLLLLVYIASNFPVSLFHTHENVKVTFAESTACEKKIYFGDVDGDCGHSTHITKQIKKCTTCDQQLTAPHTAANIFNTLQKLSFSNVHTIAIDDCITYHPSTRSNKGPPAHI
jgi:hypothetical protein